MAGSSRPTSADHDGRPPNCQPCTSMPAYRSGVRMVRAVSASRARTSTAVPSQVAPSSDSSGPYAISSSRSGGTARSAAGPAPRPSTRYRVTAVPAAGEVPHGTPQQVAPPAQQHVPVHSGLVAGLIEGERAGGRGIWQADDVHAAGGRPAVAGEGRAAGDHLLLVPVHVGPVLLKQLAAQRHRTGPVTVKAEELHARNLDHHAGDLHHRGMAAMPRRTQAYRTTPQPTPEP